MSLEHYTKRTPLEICALSTAAVTLIVIVLSLLYVLGLGVLSRIIPGIPEPKDFTFDPSYMILFTVIIPLFIHFSCFYLVLRPLKYVLARKLYDGYRSEFALIAFSLLSTAVLLLFLKSFIQPAVKINDLLPTISLILMLIGGVVVVIAVYYKYFVDKKGHKSTIEGET